jgi:hypothetical protein
MELMSTIISSLEKAFEHINEHFYNNELISPVITVQTGRSGVLGWCSVKERWESDTDKKYEINLVAEALNRPKEEILATLLHECVHLYNLQHGVKDCTDTQYHNGKFRDVALSHGLNVEKTKNRGFSLTSLNDAGLEYAKSEEFVSGMSRIPTMTLVLNPKSTPKDKKYSYVCPCCGARVRSRNPALNIICGDCNVPFERA